MVNREKLPVLGLFDTQPGTSDYSLRRSLESLTVL